MKLNSKIVDLISEGFKAETLKKMTDTQLNNLHERIVKKEPKEQVPQSGVSKKRVSADVTSIKPDAARRGVNMQVAGKNVQLQQSPSGDISFKEIAERKSKEKNNPWAICKGQQKKAGKQKMTDDEVESCIKQVKKQNEKTLKENLFIEEKILNLVDKYTLPKMSKKDFLSVLEAETKEKPDVKEKPGTKTPPKEKPEPFDPFQPAPHKQPKPQAGNAPAKPKEAPTKPGTKTPPKEKPAPFDPFQPAPHRQPKPQAKLPKQLTFTALGIKFKK
jgi:hypothetical protein